MRNETGTTQSLTMKAVAWRTRDTRFNQWAFYSFPAGWIERIFDIKRYHEPVWKSRLPRRSLNQLDENRDKEKSIVDEFEHIFYRTNKANRRVWSWISFGAVVKLVFAKSTDWENPFSQVCLQYADKPVGSGFNSEFKGSTGNSIQTDFPANLRKSLPGYRRYV